MSFRGRGGGGRSFGGRGGGGRGGRGGYRDEGPPETVVEAGEFVHACEGEAVCKLTNAKVCQA
jgi:H/ACA ribonucleoprotein complex subunit 1